MSEKTPAETLAGLITDIRMAMLTTAAPDGSLRSRPMATQRRPFDGTLWFFTGVDTAKADEISLDQHVNLAYADPKRNRYVSVEGAARIVRDRSMMERMWEDDYKAWFPNGLDDPQLALLAVRVRRAEYWDGAGSGVRQLKGFIQEHVLGESKPDPKHGHVTME